jgi:hypothetical protein
LDLRLFKSNKPPHLLSSTVTVTSTQTFNTLEIDLSFLVFDLVVLVGSSYICSAEYILIHKNYSNVYSHITSMAPPKKLADSPSASPGSRKGIRGISWTNENEAKLFLAVLKAHDVKIDYQRVADLFGNGASASGIQQHIKIMRKRDKDREAADDSSVAGKKGSMPIGGSPSGRTGTMGKKRNKAAMSDEDEGDDPFHTDEDDEGPKLKKRILKTEKVKKEAVKNELEDYSDS